MLGGCGALFFVVFVFTPLGPVGIERILLPVLGALLLLEGLAPFIGLLPQEQLLEASCPPSDLAQVVQMTGLAWLALSVCGMIFQHFMLHDAAAENGGEK